MKSTKYIICVKMFVNRRIPLISYNRAHYTNKQNVPQVTQPVKAGDNTFEGQSTLP